MSTDRKPLQVDAVDVYRQALHIPKVFAAPVLVSPDDVRAGVFVVALRAPEMDPLIAVIDMESVGRACHGEHAVPSMPEIVVWSLETFEWLGSPEDATWLSVDAHNHAAVMNIKQHGQAYRIEWTPARWPDETAGTLKAFLKAIPVYAWPLTESLMALWDA